jgi:hypothetical protein
MLEDHFDATNAVQSVLLLGQKATSLRVASEGSPYNYDKIEHLEGELYQAISN